MPRAAAWRTKPDRVLGLNRRHPLARGLIWAVYPGAGERRDLVTGATGFVRGGATWQGRDAAFGRTGAINTINADSLHWPFPSALASVTTRFTVAVWLNVTAQTSWSIGLSVPYRASGYTAPWNSLVFQRDGSSSVAFVGWANDSDLSGLFSLASGTGYWGLGRRFLVGVRDGVQGTFYRDGAPHSTETRADNPAVQWGEQRPIALGDGSDSANANEGITGRAFFAAIWGRSLSADEVRRLYREPFALIEPQRFILVPAAAGPGVFHESVALGAAAAATTAADTAAAAASDLDAAAAAEIIAAGAGDRSLTLASSAGAQQAAASSAAAAVPFGAAADLAALAELGVIIVPPPPGPRVATAAAEVRAIAPAAETRIATAFAEGRTVTAGAENRSAVAGAEHRSASVGAENRGAAAVSENRTASV